MCDKVTLIAAVNVEVIVIQTYSTVRSVDPEPLFRVLDTKICSKCKSTNAGRPQLRTDKPTLNLWRLIAFMNKSYQFYFNILFKDRMHKCVYKYLTYQ